LQKEIKDEYNTVQQELEEKRKNIVSTDKTISNLIKEKEKKIELSVKLAVELKQIEHQIQRFHKEQKDTLKLIENLESKFQWIQTDKQLFGKEGTEYDFKANDPSEASSSLTKIQEEVSKLSRSINKKVMAMHEKASQDYEDLIKKKERVENDKKSITEFFQELEQKKNRCPHKNLGNSQQKIWSNFQDFASWCQIKISQNWSIVNGRN